MMAATVVDDAPHKKRNHGDLKSKRTEAMPKHSLFGSNMEKLDEQQRKQLRELNIKQYQKEIDVDRKLKQDRYKISLPQHLQTEMSGESLKYSQQELADQADHSKRAEEFIDMLEEKSKYFTVGLKEDKVNIPSRSRETGWMNRKDLEHSKDINIMGVGGTGNYNHHKYQPKAATHQYNNIGDPLKLGMEMPVSLSPPKRHHYYSVEHVGPPDRMPKEFYMKDDPVDVNDPSTVKLPANIRHKFGTNICRNVLSDAAKVDKTIEEQHKRDQSFLKSAQPQHQKITVENDMDPSYEALGAALRLDFFPGYTHGHKRSVAKSVYTEDVYKNRVADPDQYRNQRDYLSTWAEQNVLRQRVKKAWDTYLAETLSKK